MLQAEVSMDNLIFLGILNENGYLGFINPSQWRGLGAYQTDWRMFKYFKPDFYKYFL